MKNKISALLVMPLLAGMFSSCGLTYRESANEGTNIITKEFLDANVFDQSKYIAKHEKSFDNIVLSGAQFETATVESFPNLSNYIKFSYADGTSSVYSLIKKEMVVEAGEWQYDEIKSQLNFYTLLYAFKVNSESVVVEEKVFDLDGEELFATKGDGSFDKVEQTYPTVKIDGKYTQVSCLSLYYFDNDGSYHVKNVYYSDSKIIKTAIDKDYFDIPFIQEEGKPYGKTYSNPESLYYVGGGDYYFDEIDSKMFIYNDKFEPVNSYTFDSYLGYVMFDGVMFMQNVTIVDSKYENYSFTDGYYYYVLDTYVYDLVTGVKTSLDVDYVIDSFEDIYYDEDGVARYASFDLLLISEDRLLTKGVETWIVDSKGVRHNRIDNVIWSSFGSLFKLGNYYVRESSSYVNFFNHQLDLKKSFRGSYIDNSELYMYVGMIEGGLIGILDKDGTVITKPQYFDVDDVGENNIFSATDTNDTFGFYKVENNKVVPIKEFENVSTYEVFEYDDAEDLLKIKKDASSALEYYDRFNGNRVNITERESTYSVRIPEYTIYGDLHYSAKVEVGFNTNSKAFEIRYLSDNWVDITK